MSSLFAEDKTEYDFTTGETSPSFGLSISPMHVTVRTYRYVTPETYFALERLRGHIDRLTIVAGSDAGDAGDTKDRWDVCTSYAYMTLSRELVCETTVDHLCYAQTVTLGPKVDPIAASLFPNVTSITLHGQPYDAWVHVPNIRLNGCSLEQARVLVRSNVHLHGCQVSQTTLSMFTECSKLFLDGCTTREPSLTFSGKQQELGIHKLPCSVDIHMQSLHVLLVHQVSRLTLDAPNLGYLSMHATPPVQLPTLTKLRHLHCPAPSRLSGLPALLYLSLEGDTTTEVTDLPQLMWLVLDRTRVNGLAAMTTLQFVQLHNGAQASGLQDPSIVHRSSARVWHAEL